MNASPAWRRPLDIAGYLAVWPALYLWSAACLIADAAGEDRPTAAESTMLVALGLSVYLIDRVKLADRFRDPADADTHARRDAWLWPRRRWVRLLAAGAGVVSAAAGFLVFPALALAPLLAQAGVFLYSGLPPRTPGPRRLKDVLLLKNCAAAAGLAAVAAIAVLPTPPEGAVRAAPLGMGLLVVFADCVMCDVADERGDRRHGTLTAPVVFGPFAGRLLATVLMLAGAMWIWLEGVRSPAAWAVGIGASQAALVGLGPALLRNATDLRLPLLAGLIAVGL